MLTSPAKGKYARVVDTDAGKCFLLVQWRYGTALGEQGFDVVLFHARSMRTFVGTGIKCSSFFDPALWMGLAERALAQGLKSESAGVAFKFDVNSGELSWMWPLGAVGPDLPAMEQRVALTPLPPEQPSTGLQLEAMLGVVFENFYLLHHACEQLDKQLQLKAAELTARSQELQKSHEAHQAEMADMYVKVALALNAKTDKLVDQRDRIQQLEAQVKALQEQLVEAEQVHTDPEDEGRAASDGEQAEPPAAGAGVGGAPGAAAGPSRPVPRPGPASGTRSLPLGANGVNAAAEAPGRGRAAGTAAGAAAAAAGVGAGHGAGLGGGGPGTTGRAGGSVCPMDVDGAAGVGAHTGSDSDEDLGLRGRPAAAAAAAPAATAQQGLGGAAPLPPPPPAVYASLGATQMDEDLLLADTQPAARGPLLPAPALAPLQPQEREPTAQPQQGPAPAPAPSPPPPAAAAAAPAQAQAARSGPATWGLGLGAGGDDDSDEDAALGLRR